MFNEPKNLVVIYKEKDAESINQLKKYVYTNDDVDNGKTVVGTKDGTVEVTAWDEKMWEKEKTADLLNEKILYVGNVKGVDKLIPTLDIKFNKYGVSYGFSGKQAAIMTNINPLQNKEQYDAFLKELKEICDSSTANKTRKTYFDKNDKDINKNIDTLLLWTILYGPIGAIATLISYSFGDEATVKTQQLLYGVTQLYRNDLEGFMNS